SNARSTIVRGACLSAKSFVLSLIGYGQINRSAADVAVFDISLCFALRGVNKDMVNFSAVRASESRCVSIVRFHGRHDNTPLLRAIIYSGSLQTSFLKMFF